MRLLQNGNALSLRTRQGSGRIKKFAARVILLVTQPRLLANLVPILEPCWFPVGLVVQSVGVLLCVVQPKLLALALPNLSRLKVLQVKLRKPTQNVLLMPQLIALGVLVPRPV